MSDQAPPTLEYGTPSPPTRFGWGQFAAGVFGGLAFSVVYYFVFAAVASASTAAGPVLLGTFGAVAIKTVAGVALARTPRWKALGIGLIASIPIGLMVLAGLCFGILAFN
jgi:hypothetical protein